MKPRTGERKVELSRKESTRLTPEHCEKNTFELCWLCRNTNKL